MIKQKILKKNLAAICAVTVMGTTIAASCVSAQASIFSDFFWGRFGGQDTTSQKTDKYRYEGEDYTYVIDSAGKEMISFRDENGTLTNVLEGAGEYVIRDTRFYHILTEANGIKSYSSGVKDGNKTLTVNYKETKYRVSASTTYTFFPDHIQVSAGIRGVNARNAGTSFFQRNFVNGYQNCDIRENTTWKFPENQDFPYKDFDSIVTIHTIDEQHKLYTFFRGENANTYEYFENYSQEHFPLKIENNRFDTYDLTYDLVFENTQKDADTDYYALFKSKGNSVGVKIESETESVENSTIYTKRDISLNVRVSNFTDKDEDYDISYKVYDYYGNEIGTLSRNQRLVGNGEDIYPIDFTDLKRGMYYLDVEVESAGTQYHELYPFGVIDDYSYSYRETSPFGISGVRFGDYQQNDTTIALMDKLGVANVRVGISKPEYVNSSYDLLKNSLSSLNKIGIRVSGQYLLMNDWSFSNNAAAYECEMGDTLSQISGLLSACEVGNETNLYPKYDSAEQAMYHYIDYELIPGNHAIKSYQLPLIASGVYQGDSEWFGWMNQTGVWNATDVLSTHAYSFPHSPDYTNDTAIEHSYESALMRTRMALDTYGDKTWYISEMGYPTTPQNSENMFSGVDLRTQADYTFREFILGLAYQADVVESYGFYDQLNMQKGTNPYDCEYHYGMFYDQDYYGRVMPKPLAVAYSTMTKELESVENTYSISLSSPTIRAFGLDLKETGKTSYVLWSNCSRLSNDAAEGVRTPNLPWNNQWKDSENVTVYASAPVTVTDLMGNQTFYTPDKNGQVQIAVSGSPVLVSGEIYGAE